MAKVVMTEHKAEKLISKYIPVAKHTVVKKFNDVKLFSKKVGFPLVLKIMSPDALHKSDVGGVAIVHSANDLENEFDKLISISKKKKLRLEGIMVQEFVEGKYVIIGIKNDATFGHVIMFGLGGIFVEIMKDVSFRACPINIEDAQQMIDELKGKAILYGARGEKPLNVKLLKDILVKASKIPSKHPKIEELDINPFVINDKIGKVVDARIVMTK
ncbi:acetate--CoA ligase family protein [Nanoarchaeota archaeon]